MTKDEILQLVEAMADLKANYDRRLEAMARAHEARARELDEKITKIDGVIVKFTTLKRDIENELSEAKAATDALAARVAELEAK